MLAFGVPIPEFGNADLFAFAVGVWLCFRIGWFFRNWEGTDGFLLSTEATFPGFC